MLCMGIDIGSTTSKCLVLKNGAEIIASSLVPAGIGTTGPQEACQAAIEQSGAKEEEFCYRVVTGYGRTKWENADSTVSELTAHALGNHFLFPQARTIIDIGGQDAKVIALDTNGQMTNFAMNDKCAAGTGRFLDVMAGVLKLQVDQFETIAGQSLHPVAISNTCTVFAESEVISQLAAGAETPDIVAGICNSVASRVASLAKRIGIREQVCMSGGVAQNGGVRHAMEQILQIQIQYSPYAQLTGALGAALYAYNKAK